MMKPFRRSVGAITVASLSMTTMLSGCAGTPAGDFINRNKCELSALVGTILMVGVGVATGVKPGWIVAMAIGGGLAGYGVGKLLNCDDQTTMATAVGDAALNAKTGQGVVWSSDPSNTARADRVITQEALAEVPPPVKPKPKPKQVAKKTAPKKGDDSGITVDTAADDGGLTNPVVDRIAGKPGSGMSGGAIALSDAYQKDGKTYREMAQVVIDKDGKVSKDKFTVMIGKDDKGNPMVSRVDDGKKVSMSYELDGRTQVAKLDLVTGALALVSA
jgi:surface antigen